jgi:flagellin
MGRAYQTFSRQLLTTADGVPSDGHVSLNVVNMQHMLSLGGIDTRFINSEYAASIATLHNNNNVTGNLDGLGERGFINLGNVSGKNNDDFDNATSSGIKDAIYTSDGFLKSIMFVSMGSFTDIIQRVADSRSENGAEQSRLNMVGNLLMQNQTNLEAAHGRIMDADVALESSRFARQNVLVQSSAAMVAQANQLTNVALQLLG